MPKITVLIADDHALFREGLGKLLAQSDDIQVVGEAADGLQVTDMVEALQPNILLLNPQLARLGGIDVLPLIRRKSPRTRTLILCESSDNDHMINALQLGAKGCVAKTFTHKDLVRAIRAVDNGEIWAERKVLTQVLESLRRKVYGANVPSREMQDTLSDREQEIVKWVIQGRTNKEIAAELGISDKTVKAHLSNIFGKLNISRRLELVLNRTAE